MKQDFKHANAIPPPTHPPRPATFLQCRKKSVQFPIFQDPVQGEETGHHPHGMANLGGGGGVDKGLNISHECGCGWGVPVEKEKETSADPFPGPLTLTESVP